MEIKVRTLIGLSLMLVLAACVTPIAKAPATQWAAGGPPQYYPGQELPVSLLERPAWESFLAENRDAIADISAKIKQMKAGTLAPGCIGEDARHCVATLAQALAVADSYKGRSPLKDRVDVNGNTLFDPKVALIAYLPDLIHPAPSDGFSLVLSLDARRRVSAVSAYLQRDAYGAETEDEYNATGLYEIVFSVARDKCGNLARIDLYRFFENEVKSKAVYLPNVRHENPDGTAIAGDARYAAVDYCGHHFEFTSVHGKSTGAQKFPTYQSPVNGMSIVAR